LAAVARRDEIIAFLDELLDAASWDDYGPNGLQVPGAEDVEVVVTGVSANRELFERAGDAGAQLVLCHHGLFWRNQPRHVDVRMKDRLKALFDADMSLAAYHLPLDAHPEVGNNALLCEALGLERTEPFGFLDGRPIGFVGRTSEPISREELVDRCTRALERDPLVFDGGPDRIETVGIVSGGGASSLSEAIDRGLDAFLTGEPSESGMAESFEAGVNFIAGGHWATETFGVRRLGDVLAGRFGIEHQFVAIRNPV
jgi:dinuclear metal center YbgI/SA1388 family protein